MTSFKAYHFDDEVYLLADETDGDGEVEFLYEEQPTADQIARGRL
jgi:hypothetical protein